MTLPSHFNPNARRICFDFLAAVKLSIRKSWRSVDPVFWLKCPFNKSDCPRHWGGGEGGRRPFRQRAPACVPTWRELSEGAILICEHVILFRSGGCRKFSSSLVPLPSVTLLRLTEGLWECEKTILGHHVDYCTSFMCRNANQPPLHSLHCTSLALSRCFTILGSRTLPLGSSLAAIILNISLFWQHYHIQLITIFLLFSFVLNR